MMKFLKIFWPLALVFLPLSVLPQAAIIDSLKKVIKTQDKRIQRLEGELRLARSKPNKDQTFNYCFIRFDSDFFLKASFKERLLKSFIFIINGKRFPIVYDTLTIPIHPIGFDTLDFEAEEYVHRTILKLRPKELYTILFNECISTYLIKPSSESVSEPGITALFDGDYSKGPIEISLSSQGLETNAVLKKQHYSHTLSPQYDMCGWIPQKIEFRNQQTHQVYSSFYYTFVHNEKLIITYSELQNRLYMRIEPTKQKLY